MNTGLEDRIANSTYSPYIIQANVTLDPESQLNKEKLTSTSFTMLSGGLDTLTTLCCLGY